MMRAWPVPFAPFLLLTLILSLAHVIEVQASDGIGEPPVFKPDLALTTLAPIPSQTLAHPVNAAKNDANGTASAPAVKHPVAAKNGANVVTNDTTTGLGTTGALAEHTACGGIVKRSWVFRGRIAAYLHVRDCVAPISLQPAAGLIPNSDAPSESESKPQAASSPEPQAEKDTQHTGSQAEEDTQHTGSPTAKDSQQTDSQQTDSQQTNSQQTDSQPAQVAPQVDSQPATPAVAPAPTDSPVIVQGQTVPANGNPITVNNQLVRVSSGSIYVGSSAAPIPQAQAAQSQAAQSQAEPIVAGTLTFHPASPSPAPQVAPSPVVVGGLTFSAAQSESSVDSNTAPDQPQARPVVVGGKTYAPITPTSQSEPSQAGVNTPEQGDSEPSSSQEQSNNAVDNDNTDLDQSNSQPAQADSKPIVIGGMTYTPVAANPTAPSQSAAVFSFDGMAVTQGGAAVTISGTRYSLGPSGVVVGTSSLPFSTPAPTTSLLTIGSQTLTALPGGEGGFEIGHSTLLPGSSAVVIGGTTYSINQADSLIVGTSTIALATAGSNNMGNSALTAGGETFTPLGSTAVVVDGTTISVGGSAITEDGTRLSLASNGLLIGSSTFAYATPAVNTATVSTASGTFSTGVLPSSGTIPTSTPSRTGGIPTTFPSPTGGVGSSAASAKTIAPSVITIWLGIAMILELSW